MPNNILSQFHVGDLPVTGECWAGTGVFSNTIPSFIFKSFFVPDISVLIIPVLLTKKKKK